MLDDNLPEVSEFPNLLKKQKSIYFINLINYIFFGIIFNKTRFIK